MKNMYIFWLSCLSGRCHGHVRQNLATLLACRERCPCLPTNLHASGSRADPSTPQGKLLGFQ